MLASVEDRLAATTLYQLTGALGAFALTLLNDRLRVTAGREIRARVEAAELT